MGGAALLENVKKDQAEEAKKKLTDAGAAETYGGADGEQTRQIEN